jgi:hypothetical protein
MAWMSPEWSARLAQATRIKIRKHPKNGKWYVLYLWRQLGKFDTWEEAIECAEISVRLQQIIEEE